MSLRFTRKGWVPPARRLNKSVGANVMDDLKKNRIWIIAGAIILVAVIVSYMNRSKIESLVAPITGAAVEEVVVAPAPKEAPVKVVVTPTGPATCPTGPRPIDVYQSDLGSANGANNITPGVALDGNVPVDYTAMNSGVNPEAVWQSSQLLPTNNCGQSLQGVDDWSLYAPSNAQVVNFLSAGYNAGQDTVLTTLKNASLDLRPEPAVSNCFQSPWNQSSWVDNSLMRTDWSHSLVA